MARTEFSQLRDAVVAKPGAAERLAFRRAETLEEIRLYELRHGEAISQAELAGRLDVTQGAISKLEHSDDVRVSTLRQYLEALGARLELVAVFDDEDRRVPITSAATTRPDRAAVSTVSARLATTNADEGGDAARELSRTTVVQHDERQRAPTGADDSAARRSRSARSAGRTPLSADQLPRASVHS